MIVREAIKELILTWWDNAKTESEINKNLNMVVSIESGSTIIFKGYLGKYINATMDDDNTLYDIVKILNNRVVIDQLRSDCIHYIYIE